MFGGKRTSLVCTVSATDISCIGHRTPEIVKIQAVLKFLQLVRVLFMLFRVSCFI